MDSYTLKNGVVFLKLKTLGGVLAVLGGDITACAGHAGSLVFGTFEDNLYAVAFCFLCLLRCGY